MPFSVPAFGEGRFAGEGEALLGARGAAQRHQTQAVEFDPMFATMNATA